MQKKSKFRRIVDSLFNTLVIITVMSFSNTVLAHALGDFFAYMIGGDLTIIGTILFVIFTAIELVVGYHVSTKGGE